jgi:hypothetical protein
MSYTIDYPADEENWNKYIRKKNCASSWLFTRTVPSFHWFFMLSYLTYFRPFGSFSHVANLDDYWEFTSGRWYMVIDIN